MARQIRRVLIKLEIESTFISWSKTKDVLDPLRQHGETLRALHNAGYIPYLGKTNGYR